MAQGDPDAPVRRIFTWKRLLLGSCIVVLLILLWAALWIRGVATQRFEADIATLIPADVALALEARRLRTGPDAGGLSDLVAFGDALLDDPSWQTAEKSRAMAELIGRDPKTGRTKDVRDEIEDLLKQARSVQIPIGDTLFGPLDPEADFFSGDIVLAMRPGKDGQEMVKGRENVEIMLLARVSGRIKVYASLDSWVPSSEKTKLRIDPGGYTVLDVINGNQVVTTCYALIGDVMAFANTEKMIREIVALSKRPGGTGNSLFESPLYAEAIGAAVTAAGSKEAVTSATARLFTNQAQLRQIADVDAVFDDVFEGMKEKDGGEFIAQTGDDVLRTMVDPRSIRASLTLISATRAMGSGPTIVLDTALLYNAAGLPSGLRKTLQHGGATSQLFELAGGSTFAAMSMGEDLPGLVRQLGGSNDTVSMDLLEALAQPGYLSDELGLLFDQPSSAPREPLDAYAPRLIFAFGLSSEGLRAGEDPRLLAEIAFSNLLPRNKRDEAGTVQFLDDVHGNHRIVTFFTAKDPDNPDRSSANNGVSGSLRQFFGPDAEPACAVVRTDAGELQGGYLLLATNSDYLRKCLDAWDANASRFRRLGGVGVAMSYFDNGPAFARGMFDVRELLSGYFSPDGIRMAANEDAIDLLPSERTALRARADREAGGAENTAESDRLYNEYRRQRLLTLKAERNRDTTKALDARNVWLVLNWFGYQLRPIGAPGEAADRCHLRMVFAFGQ